MNCKVGDLAVIVRPNVKENKGLLVEVERRTHGRGRGIYWWVRAVSGPALRSDGTKDDHAALPDWALKPVRRPRVKREPVLPKVPTLQLAFELPGPVAPRERDVAQMPRLRQH